MRRAALSINDEQRAWTGRGGDLAPSALPHARSNMHARARTRMYAQAAVASGQIAYFHGVKTRLSTLGTGDVPRGSDCRMHACMHACTHAHMHTYMYDDFNIN